jgi:hypothetical protein
MPDEPSAEMKQQRMREFMQMLPLTLEIAGLPKGPIDRLLTADQMEARLINLRTAYKLARKLLREVSNDSI